MRMSLKAPLLSGLIFPGIGHMVLKQYLRGWVLILVTLVALAEVVSSAFQQAQIIVERINTGDIPIEPGALAEVASSATSSTQSLVDNIAVFVLAACWLVGIVDSCRLAIKQGQSNE